MIIGEHHDDAAVRAAYGRGCHARGEETHSVRCADAVLTGLEGDDELYIVPGSWSGDAGEIQSFLPETCSFESGAPPEFFTSFERLGAVRFFADGLDTNYCVSSIEDAHDIEQAERTGGPRWV